MDATSGLVVELNDFAELARAASRAGAVRPPHPDDRSAHVLRLNTSTAAILRWDATAEVASMTVQYSLDGRHVRKNVDDWIGSCISSTPTNDFEVCLTDSPRSYCMVGYATRNAFARDAGTPWSNSSSYVV